MVRYRDTIGRLSPSMGSLLVRLLIRSYLEATNTISFYPCVRWNASRAFASYLDAHRELYRDRSVLELGAGGGLPGLVTAKNGAKSVGKQKYLPASILIEISIVRSSLQIIRMPYLSRTCVITLIAMCPHIFATGFTFKSVSLIQLFRIWHA